MVLSIDEIRNWEPAALADLAQQVTRRRDVHTELAAQLGDIGRLEFWKGSGGDAARDRFMRVLAGVQSHSEDVDAVRRAVQRAEDDLIPVKQMLAEADELAGRYQFTIGPNGEVNDVSEPVLGSEQEVAGWEEQRRQGRGEIVAKVNAVVREASRIDSEAAAALSKGFGFDVFGGFESLGSTPPGVAGRDDGQAVYDGTASEEQIREIGERLAQAELTPDEIAALSRGEQIELPDDQWTYLKAFYDGAGKDGVFALSDKFGRTGSTAPQRALANGLFTLTNPNIHSFSGNHWQTPLDMINGTGSVGKLPSDLADLFNGPVVRDPGNDVHTYRAIDDYDDLSRFTQVLQHADPRVQQGSY